MTLSILFITRLYTCMVVRSPLSQSGFTFGFGIEQVLDGYIERYQKYIWHWARDSAGSFEF
jgi:hypothetical protein